MAASRANTQPHGITTTLAPAPVDDETLLAEMLADIDARVGAPTAVVNLDLQQAADTITAVISGLRGDRALYDRYKRLVAMEETSFEVLRRLQRQVPVLWLAAWRGAMEDNAPDTVIPGDLAEEAVKLRDEMLPVIQYNYGDDKRHGAELLAMTHTNDRQAIAGQLRLMASLVLGNPREVEHDRRYKPEWTQKALTLSQDIRGALGAKELGGVRWKQRAAVLWTTVEEDYAELMSVGRFLLRNQEAEGERRFPALRKGRGRRSADESAVDDDTTPIPAPTPDVAKPAPTDATQAPANAEGEKKPATTDAVVNSAAVKTAKTPGTTKAKKAPKKAKKSAKR